VECLSKRVAISKDSVLINGEPTILLCASLFYFRLPRETWADRMAQLRMAGYNCIDVYMPWNFHETRPGEWHFDGMADVALFLRMAAEHDLYVIARPGPYICSEWDGGAIPAWITSEKYSLRQNDDAYITVLKTWLDMILPIINRYQLGREGSIVMLQLENELDFFCCKEPEAYMLRLANIAKEHGIHIPLIACAGQADPQGAYGWAKGLYPTFNVYSGDRYGHLEQQCSTLRLLANEHNTPLLITETDRDHDGIKRKLLSGARLVAPYNQVGGTNVDMTNGISNWGSTCDMPLSLMATDYDFFSMITASGLLRPEFWKARLIGAMLATMGHQLGKAEPHPSCVEITSDFTRPLWIDEQGRDTPYCPSLKTSHGWLLGISNLGQVPGTANFIAEDGTKVHIFSMPGQTSILPYAYRLDPWGIQAQIAWSEAEICQIHRKGEDVYLLMYGPESSRVCLVGDHGEKLIAAAGEETAACMVIGCMRVHVQIVDEQTAARMVSVLPPVQGNADKEPDVVPAGRLLMQHPFSLHSKAVPAGKRVCSMEDAGVYRGGIFYDLSLAKDGQLLLHHAADILTVWHENAQAHSLYATGGHVMLPVQAGRCCIYAESWGHSNFEDARLPSLHMGSGKGIDKITFICRVEDVTELWRISPRNKYTLQEKPEYEAQDRIMATSINTWSYPVSPMTAVFRRSIFFDADCNRFLLRFEKMPAQVTVWVNNRLVGNVHPGDPCIDLTEFACPGKGALVQLEVLRRYSHDSFGAVSLICGSAVNDAELAALDVDSWKKIAPETVGVQSNLPIDMKTGEQCMLTGFLPEDKHGNFVLVAEGRGIELTLVAAGKVCGRMLLKTEGFPEVRGGSARRIFIPGNWMLPDRGVACLVLQSLSEDARLDKLYWERVV